MLVTGAVASVLTQVGVQTGAKTALHDQVPIRFGPVLAQSLRYLWRVLGAWVAVGAVFLLILVLTSCCQFASAVTTAGLATLCTFPFLLMGSLLLGVGMDIATGLTGAAIILDDLGLRPAFRRTWDLLRGRTTPVLLAGLALSLILRISPALLSVPSLAASFLALWFAAPTGAGIGGTTDITLALQLGYLPILLIALAAVEAFVYCAWAHAYLRLSRPAAPEFAA